MTDVVSIAERVKPQGGRTAIRTQGLSKRYGPTDALKNLNLEVSEGEVVGYLGPNGAGKTTTISLLLGLARPTAGRAEMFGIDCQRQPVEAHRRVAYVPGEANLWPSLTGAETLHLLGRVQGRVDAAYRDELIKRFDFDASKKVRAYSKGNRQKLILIAGLMTRAALLLLDEPTTGLDPLMEQAFRQCIHEARERGQTVFLSSHIMSEVEALCDRVGILRDGESGRDGDDGGIASPLRPHRRGHLRRIRPRPHRGRGGELDRDRRTRRALPGAWVCRAVARGAATSGVHELLSREPSLEELFLAHYGRRAESEGGTADAG